MENDIKKLQSRLLDMAKVFHDFCEEHNLKYYMLGGTMLGAVRHKGFIPWDDDMDFGMMREDYDKMLALKDELPQGYSFNDHISDKNFKYGFCKLYDENSTYIESMLDSDYVGGIYIDIFPLDNIGNDIKKADKLFKKIKFRRKLRSLVYIKGKRSSLIKNIVVKTCQAVFKESNKWYEWPYKVIRKYKNKDCKLITNVYGANMERETIEKEVFGKPVLYDFEDTKFYGVEDYDKYLSKMYGDYMELPPEEKRKKHQISYIDYDLPYKEYRTIEKGKEQDGTTIKSK